MAASATVPHPSTCKGRGCEHEEMPVNSSSRQWGRRFLPDRWRSPRTGGEGEEVKHVPSVHTWPAWHGIRHPPQLAGSLKVSSTSQNKIFAQQGSAGLVRSPPIASRRETDLSSARQQRRDRKSTRLNSSHLGISYAV